MDRPYHRDRDRDRDYYHRDRDIHRDRDRDRDFHRQPRRPSGFSDGPPPPENHRNHHGGFSSYPPPPPDLRRGSPPPPPLDHRRGGPPYPPPHDPHRGGFSTGGRNFDSSPRHPPAAAEEFRPLRGPLNGPGGGGGGFGSDFPPQRPPPFNNFPVNHRHPSPPPQLSGQKRGFSFPSPENYEAKNFVKLFVGSVPNTSTEEDIRPLFEEQGKVLEVALIKDKRTGQQQGCCFIKYGSPQEADRAIRALHNQYTLPGAIGPIQVRYADGERERLGNVAVEYKLFVGSLNKYATEKEVEEIFAPYGRIDDVYLMRDERRQSRGCGFVKFNTKDSAMAAVTALNGIYTMRGCEQPLIVRFADPKRPRAGEPRTGPAVGGPGSGPSPAPGFRPAPGSKFLDTKGSQDPPNAGQSFAPRNMGLSPNASIYNFGNQLHPRSGEAPISSNPGGYTGAQGGGFTGAQGNMRDGAFAGPASVSTTSAQDYNQSFHQVPLSGQQTSPLPPLRPPQHFSPALQQSQVPGSFFQAPTSQPSVRPLSQQQTSTLAPQPFQPSQMQSLPGQSFPTQYQVQQSTPGADKPRPNSLSSQNNSQPPTSAPQQPPLYQQSPSQLSQMLSQQTQTLQASFQSSQQTFSHLQQQFQMMQPLPNNQLLQQSQQSFQASKQQWAGDVPTATANGSHGGHARDATQPTSLAPFVPAVTSKPAPAKCDWTEHTSPGGYKYYYNSTTGESTWEKPEELTLYEQQQQKSAVTQPQPQVQQNLQAIPTQQVTQSQPSQLQTQFRSGVQFQHPPTFSIYPTPGALGNQPTQQEKTYSQSLPPANSVNDPSTFQQGFPAAQNWAWNNSKGN